MNRARPSQLVAVAVVLFALALTLTGASIARAGGGATMIVAVGDNWFCDSSYFLGSCDTTIAAGDTVTWDYAAGSRTHTTTECGASCDSPSGSPVWDSGFMSVGDTYLRTFDTPGTFLYYCVLHPFDMRGRVIVLAAPTPTATAQPAATPLPQPSAATPAPSTSAPAVAATVPAAVPGGGGGPTPTAAGPAGGVPTAVAVAALLLVVGTAALALARRRG